MSDTLQEIKDSLSRIDVNEDDVDQIIYNITRLIDYLIEKENKHD